MITCIFQNVKRFVFFNESLGIMYVCVWFHSLIVAKDSVLQQREKHGVIYQRCFPGCHLIDWLLQNAEVESRKQGVELCRALQEHGIFQHGKTSSLQEHDIGLNFTSLQITSWHRLTFYNQVIEWTWHQLTCYGKVITGTWHRLTCYDQVITGTSIG